MKILINYADKYFFKSQKENSETGLKFGFDKVISYNRSNIDTVFLDKNSDVLNRERGAGYWLWKPYFILKTLDESNDGDFVFYSDSASYFIDSIEPLIEICKKDIRGITLFRYPHIVLSAYCKRDAFIYSDCDTEEYHNGKVWISGFQLYRKCKESVDFVRDVLKYSCDPRIITDDPCVCGLPNFADFRENRHDQSVLSLMAIKHKISPYKGPQYETPDPDGIGESGQIIVLHRDKR